MIFRLLIVTLLAGCSQLPVITTSIDTQQEAPVMAAAPVMSRPVASPAPIATPPAVMAASVDVQIPEVVVTHNRFLKFEATAGGKERNLPQRVNDFTDQLSSAEMVLDIPASTNIDNPLRVKLAINTATGTIGDINQPVKPGRSTAVIQISKILEVKLVAPDFTKVIALMPDRQAISFTEPTMWEWDLSGAPPGKHDIHLSINAIVTVDNDRTERSIKTFESTVTVEITPQQWLLAMLKEHMQWIWSTLLLPAGMWLWKKWKGK